MRRTLLSLLLASTTLAAFGQTIVYDNTSHSENNNMPLLPEWRNDSAEAGDDIWLGGTDRYVTNLRILFTYRGTLPGTIDLQIRFRSIIEEDQTPGEVFYDSGKILSVPTLAGANDYRFDIPGVLVPDHFVWTVQAYNRQGSVGELGPAYYNPATVGFSDDFFWLSDEGSPWTPYSWGGDPYASFGATFTAVPEPASLLAIGVGLAAFLKRKRPVR